MDWVQMCFYTGFPSRQTTDGCICNELISTKPSKLIGTERSFQMNHTSICGTIMTAFILYAMPVNIAFQSAYSNNTVAEQSELWSGVKFRTMDDPICYELRLISKATGMSVKCYSSKSFPSFKACLELSFRRIMHAHMLQRLFGISVQPKTCNFFFGLLITQKSRLSSTSGIWSVCVLLMIRMSSFKRRNLDAHTSIMEFSFTNRHSKTVWLHATSYSSIYCHTWWIHQILILDTFFCFENFATYLYQYKLFVH